MMKGYFFLDVLSQINEDGHRVGPITTEFDSFEEAVELYAMYGDLWYCRLTYRLNGFRTSVGWDEVLLLLTAFQ